MTWGWGCRPAERLPHKSVEEIIDELEDKIFITDDNTKLVAWLLGHVLAERILSVRLTAGGVGYNYERVQICQDICSYLSKKYQRKIYLDIYAVLYGIPYDLEESKRRLRFS